MDKKILEIAKYVIKNKATMQEVSDYFNISIRSASNYTGPYLAKFVKENPEYVDIYNEVMKIKQASLKSNHFITSDVINIANYVILEHATIKDVCEHFKISRKTAQKYTGEYLEQVSRENDDYKNLYKSVQLIKQANQGKSAKNVDLENVVIDIINNKLSNEVACEKYNISESTLLDYIASLPDDSKLKIKYNQTKDELIRLGNFVGGSYSIRTASVTEFEALEIAEDMIRNCLTIDEASYKFKIPRSTLYEAIRRIDDDDIQIKLNELFDRRKKR